MRVLTMSGRKVRRWNRDQRVALWGSTHWRQFGSPDDLHLARTEADAYERLRRGQAMNIAALQSAMLAAAEISRGFAQIQRALSISAEDLVDLQQAFDSLGPRAT